MSRVRTSTLARPLALMAALTCLMLAACDASQQNAYVAPPPPKVTVAQPVNQPVTLYFTLTGNTAPVKSVNLEARVQGFLESINYVDGASVTKGTQLFGLQQDTYEAQLAQSNATLAANTAAQTNAQTNYERQLTLSKQSYASQSTLQDAKTTLDQANANVLGAQASLQLATINLGYTKIVAPFDGTVTNHLADIGSLVGVSGPTTLATIVQTDPLYAYFNVSEPQVLAIKQGLNKQGRTLKDRDFSTIMVEIGLQNEEGYPHKGHLDYVAPQLDSSTGTLQVRAIFDNKDRALLPGLFVRVRIPIGHLDKALLVADDAIGVNQLGSYVLVVGKDDIVEQKQVKTGQLQGEMRIIEAGLDAADWVITQGIQSAAPGGKVVPDKAAGAPGATQAAAPASTP